ncbi:MAG: S8 family peptidase [Bacteroidia bacterium]
MHFRHLFIILFFLHSKLIAQQRSYYFIYFKDKPNTVLQKLDLKKYYSEKAIERRVKYGLPITADDFPPDSLYTATIISKGALVVGQSRWFNGVLVLAEPKIISDSIKPLAFISSVDYAGKYTPSNIEKKEINFDAEFELIEQRLKQRNRDSLYYGLSHNQLTQLNVQTLHKNNYWGNGVTIAVLDAGFINADKISAVNHLIKNKKIIGIHDFVEHIDNVFVEDDHGLAVLSCMASNQPGVIMGAAPQANYILLRTENARTETLVEEYNWLLGAEYADSAGADIINSSLGYTKHDEKTMGHSYNDLNGKTTVVTKAAEMAAQKGMLVFVSAGNEGNDPWRFIAAPADAESVVTVGAVDKHGHYAGFSSIGPTADKRLKPDVVALGSGAAILSTDGRAYLGNGTSYACPVLVGASALLVQKHPNVHPKKIKEVILWSGNKAHQPDRFTGYGIPDMQIADFILSDQQLFGVAFARIIGNSFQVVLNAYSPQKVKLTFYGNQGESFSQTVQCNEKGLNQFLFPIPKNLKNESIKAIEALFLKSNANSVFLFN